MFTTFQKEILLPQKKFLQDKSLRLYKLYHDFINKKLPMYNIEKPKILSGSVTYKHMMLLENQLLDLVMVS